MRPLTAIGATNARACAFACVYQLCCRRRLLSRLKTRARAAKAFHALLTSMAGGERSWPPSLPPPPSRASLNSQLRCARVCARARVDRVARVVCTHERPPIAVAAAAARRILRLYASARFHGICRVRCCRSSDLCLNDERSYARQVATAFIWPPTTARDGRRGGDDERKIVGIFLLSRAFARLVDARCLCATKRCSARARALAFEVSSKTRTRA